MIDPFSLATEKVVGKVAEAALKYTSEKIDEATKPKYENPVLNRFQAISKQIESGLSEEALATRSEAAAHSASKFFNLPDAEIINGDAIGVYTNCDIFMNNDVFESNLTQFKDMNCVSFEDMSKIWSHECGHRILQMEYPNSWTQELGADFFSGVRSEMLGLPTSNFEKVLASSPGSETHPIGALRAKAIEFGRQTVRNLQEQGITPNILNCKEAFAQSPFAQITYDNCSRNRFAGFVNDKAYHYENAAKAKEKAESLHHEAEIESKKGNLSKATELENKAKTEETKYKEEMSAAQMSSRLVDTYLYERTPLTEKDRIALKERTSWPDVIVDSIRTKEEAQIYEDAGLVYGEINGKPALLQPNLEGEAYNSKKYPDLTNKELASKGLAPCSKDGRPYELHHIGQNPNSPLAELTYYQHHSQGNFCKLHTFDETKVHGLGNTFNKERADYWAARSKSM